MPKVVPYAPGNRVAFYRKRAKVSAEELAERAGFGLTRSIVANLENGRKEDITVRQLMAIAFVLGVSPVHLIFDARQPYEYVELTDGPEPFRTASWLGADWFGGRFNVVEIDLDTGLFDAPRYSQLDLDEYLIDGQLRRRDQLLNVLNALEALPKDDLDPARRDRIRDTQAALYEIDKELRRAGAKIDDPLGPGTPF